MFNQDRFKLLVSSSESSSSNLSPNSNNNKTHSKLSSSMAKQYLMTTTEDSQRHYCPLSFKSYYTNSPWINKRIMELLSPLPKYRDNALISTTNYRTQQEIKFNPPSFPSSPLAVRQQLSNQKRFISDLKHDANNRTTSNNNDKYSLIETEVMIFPNHTSLKRKYDSSSTSIHLIHKSVISYASQIKQRSCQKLLTSTTGLIARPSSSCWKFLRKCKTKSNTDSGVVTPFDVLVQGYIWHRVVARGSFSTLYEASRLFISRGRVACKHIHLAKINESRVNNQNGKWRFKMQQQFLEEEIKILKQVKHPNIVPLYEIIQSDSGHDYYIMMKFAVNKTIADYLYKFWMKPLPEVYAKRWTRQLMSALQYIHEEHRIAHRDLKLENFLLDEKYAALLSDFGLAISMSIMSSSSSTSSSTNLDQNIWENGNMDRKRIENLLSIQCGTVEYMAPEVHQNSLTGIISWNYDPFRADIYSMGVCLFEMVNYYRPFVLSISDQYNSSRSQHNLLWRQRNRQYKFNKRIYLTEECHRLLDEMLEPRPAFRPTARQVLDHRWFKYSIR